MKPALMRFGGSAWLVNPETVQIESKRKLSSHTLPFYKTFCGDLGAWYREIKGEGIIYGEDCVNRYAQMFLLQQTGSVGVLSLPGLKPFYAVFSYLKAVASSKPDEIRYEFRFSEIQPLSENEVLPACHVVKADENLFDIAHIYGVSVDVLVEKNPLLKRPDGLCEGDRVMLC